MKKSNLALNMRPENIEDIVGQDHVIGPDTSLYRILSKGNVPNLLLYGPPGTGKTSIAYAISKSTGHHFISLNATLIGKKDLELAVKEAEENEKTIIFVDEVHSLNKSQQDFLLKHLEDNTFSFIAATTENPFHSVRGAIISRMSQILQLKPLDSDAILRLLKNALSYEHKGLGHLEINIEPTYLMRIATTTADGRAALNILESIIWASAPDENNVIQVEEKTVKEILENRGLPYHDKDGDSHYDNLSFFQKCVRGSDVNASLVALAKLLEGGDLNSIIRRIGI